MACRVTLPSFYTLSVGLPIEVVGRGSSNFIVLPKEKVFFIIFQYGGAQYEWFPPKFSSFFVEIYFKILKLSQICVFQIIQHI